MAKNSLLRAAKQFSAKSRVSKNQQGSAGYDNARENIDPHIRTQTTSTRQGTIEHTPTNPKDIVNKEYVDAKVINTGIDLFAYNSASDTGSYKQFKLEPSAGAEVEGIVNIAGNATSQSVGARITEVGIDIPDLLHSLTTGIYNFHIHMKAEKALRLKFYAEFYIRATGGAETLIATTEESNYLGIIKETYDIHSIITEDYPLTAGDRIVVKGFANNYSAVATNIYIYIEGDTATRVSIRGLSAPRTHNALAGVTADQHHNESHTIVSHSDTTATGTELNTLTNDSMVDSLHRHSELSASDGSPNPVISINATGNVGIGTLTPGKKLEVNGTIKSTGLNFTGAASEIKLKDNEALALNITEDTNSYLKCITTDGTANERVDVGKQLQISGASRMRAYLSSAQSINSTTWTKIQLNTENFDNLSEYDNVTNYRFTALQTGYYLVTGSIFTSSITGGTAIAAIYKQGTSHRITQTHSPTAGLGLTANVIDIVYLTAGQYVELWGWQNYANPGNIKAGSASTFMAVHRLS